MVPTYKQRSALQVGVGFFGLDDVPELPNVAEYKLTDLTSGTVLVDYTVMSPTLLLDSLDAPVSCEATIDIPASANDLQSTRHTTETRELLVVADRDTDIEYLQTFTYNLARVKSR